MYAAMVVELQPFFDDRIGIGEALELMLDDNLALQQAMKRFNMPVFLRREAKPWDE